MYSTSRTVTCNIIVDSRKEVVEEGRGEKEKAAERKKICSDGTIQILLKCSIYNPINLFNN